MTTTAAIIAGYLIIGAWFARIAYEALTWAETIGRVQHHEVLWKPLVLGLAWPVYLILRIVRAYRKGQS